MRDRDQLMEAPPKVPQFQTLIPACKKHSCCFLGFFLHSHVNSQADPTTIHEEKCIHENHSSSSIKKNTNIWMKDWQRAGWKIQDGKGHMGSRRNIRNDQV